MIPQLIQDQIQWSTAFFLSSDQSVDPMTQNPLVTMINDLPLPHITHPLKVIGSQVLEHYLTYVSGFGVISLNKTLLSLCILLFGLFWLWYVRQTNPCSLVAVLMANMRPFCWWIRWPLVWGCHQACNQQLPRPVVLKVEPGQLATTGSPWSTHSTLFAA